MSANERQIDGDHYRSEYQHWDFITKHHIDYLTGCATKYVIRWRKKNGVSDLKKALHFTDKLIEVIQTGQFNIDTPDIPTDDIIKFLQINKVQTTEASIFTLLVTWIRTEQVQQAARLIQGLIDDAASIVGTGQQLEASNPS